MSMKDVQEKLANAYSLLDFSEQLITDFETIPLSELFRVFSLLKKNLRDAKNLINDANAELDDIVKELDKEEVREVVAGLEG